MGLSKKRQLEAKAWTRDLEKYRTGIWTWEQLLEVSIFRVWNNVDIALRVRGDQDRTDRSIVCEYCSTVDNLSAEAKKVGEQVLLWLTDQGYKHTPDRDQTGGEEGVAWIATLIRPLPEFPIPERLPMPEVLKKKKTKA